MSNKAQQQIPGTERIEDEELTAAAEEYRTFRDERMKLGEKEAEAKNTLIEMMKRKGHTKYVYEDNASGKERKVILSQKDNVSVATVKRAESGGDGGEDVTVQ